MNKVSLVSNMNIITIGSTNTPGQEFLTILLYVLSSVGIFCIIFFVFYNLLKKILIKKNVDTIKKILIFLILGIIYSSISPILIIIMKQVNPNYLVLSQIVVLTLFALFTSSICMVGSFIVFLFSNIFLPDYGFQPHILFLLVFYVIATIFVGVVRFLFGNKFKYVFILSFLMFCLMCAVSLIFYNGNNLTSILINIAINYPLFLLMYAIGNYLTNLIDNTYKLRTSIHYDNDYFVNSHYSKIAFDEYIKTNKTDIGVFLTISFINIENLLTTEGKQAVVEAEKTLIRYVLYNFKDTCFYFKTFNNEYGLFFKVKDKNKIDLNKSIANNNKNNRTEDDFLYELEQVLKMFPNKIDFNNQFYDIQIVGYASLYGIHSNDFYKLSSFNEDVKKYWAINNDINIVKLYRSNILKNNIDETNKLEKVKQEHDFNNISLSLIKSSLNNEKYFIPKIFWLKESIFSFDKLHNKFSDNQEKLNLVIRYIAYHSLKLFNQYLIEEDKKNIKTTNSKILIDYPVNELSKNVFSVIEIYTKIKKHNLEPHNVIFNFNLANSTIKDNSKELNEIMSLYNKGFGISFFNFSIKDIKVLSKIKKFSVVLSKDKEKENKIILKQLNKSKDNIDNIFYR
ncbi:hypothetical protein [Malacoplasma iowae]|uniref:Uncharacterized protein n=1 Tax=Malacoplasma iowae DK-CPA TaxID=1394179 RepID=A0A084U4D2_MALIO|nr:hypothetical protein [Malacoplasma iowae]KFB07818.1 hypothetical protein P271_680 [Malacoplasma iowae DK-CPA]WPL41272.1 hypothetical protein QX184_01565 [Malacoplasma iowae]